MFNEKKSDLEEDFLLWNNFIRGDDSAYECIYKKYIDILYVYGFQFLKDKESLEDCIHDVFTKIYIKRQKLPAVSNLKLYLLISLKNNILNSIKVNRRYSTESDETIKSVSEYITVEDQLINEELKESKSIFLERALSILSPRQKEIVNYRLVLNFSMDEICSLMNINYQSAQNLLQRSYKKIRIFISSDKKIKESSVLEKYMGR